MKMSTKCRYGLRALTDLAYYGRAGHVPLHQIAKRQEISLKYLEQEFAVLRKAGIVRSVKGAQGGYMLARDPEQITMAELVEILEGDLSVVDISSDAGLLTSLRRCVNDYVWNPLNKQIAETLNQITLADLAAEFDSQQQSDTMYYI